MTDQEKLQELIDAGAIPGNTRVALFGDVIPRAVVYAVPRAVAELGAVGGDYVAGVIQQLPEHDHGSVFITFDGWADDPRPLAFVPEVVEFCAAMLLGPDLNDSLRAKALSLVLMDENRLLHAGLPLDIAFELSGFTWLVMHAYADITVVRHPDSPSGLAKDLGLALTLALYLLQNNLPPHTPGRAGG